MVLRGYKREASILQLPSADGMAAIAQTLDAWLLGLTEAQRSQLPIHVTGGARPMAMAAQDVFSRHGLPLFYLSERSRTVSYLNARFLDRDIGRVMELRAFLAAHGFSQEARRPSLLSQPEQAEFTRWLGENAPALAEALHMLRRVLVTRDDGLGNIQVILNQLTNTAKGETLLQIEREPCPCACKIARYCMATAPQ